MRQFWLAKKDRKKISLFPFCENGEIRFKIIGDGYEKIPENFDPEQGTVSHAVVTCPCCGSTVDAKTTRKLFQEGKSGQRMVCVILQTPGEQGKKYRIAIERDFEIYKKAEKYLKEKEEVLRLDWGMEPVPDEPLIYDPRNIWITPYYPIGEQKIGNLFNSRQKLALIAFTEKVRMVHKKLLDAKYDVAYAIAIESFLSLGIDEMARFNSVLNPWKVDAEAIVHVLEDRQSQCYGIIMKIIY